MTQVALLFHSLGIFDSHSARMNYGPAPAPVQNVEDVGIVAAKYGIMAIVGPLIIMVLANFLRVRVFRRNAQGEDSEATRVNIEMSNINSCLLYTSPSPRDRG